MLAEREQLSWFDALIAEAAISSRCTVLFSEDFSHGRQIAGLEVVMSLDTCNSLMETVHLLRSPANAAHQQRSREQADRGALLDHLLIHADPIDAGSCSAGLDRRPLRRINQLIEACLRDSFVGIGKPEPLRENLSGWWSRRIDAEHRLVYRPESNVLVILACRHPYR